MPTDREALRPLPYHREAVAYLEEEERALWHWYATSAPKAEEVEARRTELLRSCYRLDEAAHPEIVQAARDAVARLGVAVPVTLYQSQEVSHTNAALHFVPGECHVVFSGSLLGVLSPTEVTAVVGHELAHHRLWLEDGGKFLVAERLLSAMGSHRGAPLAHAECARRFALETELYADRGALVACGSLTDTVAALVKTETGFPGVRGDAYLAQAREILAKVPEGRAVGSQRERHPETFLRARALELFDAEGVEADAAVERLVAAGGDVTTIDLVAQRQWTRLTRRLVADLVRPERFQTAATLAHARMFFPDLLPAAAPDATLDADLAALGPAAADYLSYVLLDFAAVDPDLTDEALPDAVVRSRRLGIGKAFEGIAPKALSMRTREWGKVVKRADELAASAVAGVAAEDGATGANGSGKAGRPDRANGANGAGGAAEKAP